MPHNNYFFIDGSSLLADIESIQKEDDEFKGEKLNLLLFIEHFVLGANLEKFHEGGYRRIVFYFVKSDEARIKKLIILPDFRSPGLIEDLEIKYCGKKIKQYAKAHEWLTSNNAPQYVTASLYKSEKAVDTQIVCDALSLAALNKLDRLFLYTNDYDFIPLCEAVKRNGMNINLIQLTSKKVNKDLVKNCDGFCSFENQLKYIFAIS